MKMTYKIIKTITTKTIKQCVDCKYCDRISYSSMNDFAPDQWCCDLCIHPFWIQHRDNEMQRYKVISLNNRDQAETIIPPWCPLDDVTTIEIKRK